MTSEMAEGGELSGMTPNAAENEPSRVVPLDSLHEAVQGIVAELLPAVNNNTPQTLLHQVSLLSGRGCTRASGHIPMTELVTSPPRSS
jgi:hypothetical protein